MGSERFYPESPVRRVRVGDFWIDETPVTNRQFAAFVDATGYRTVAEIVSDPRDCPGLAAQTARAGSLVFERTAGPVALDDYRQWWAFVSGAEWRQSNSVDPSGPPIGQGVKDGSHLCAANYCQRYRTAARHAQAIESATSHIGSAASSAPDAIAAPPLLDAQPKPRSVNLRRTRAAAAKPAAE